MFKYFNVFRKINSLILQILNTIMKLSERIIQNLVKIKNERNFTQKAIGQMGGIDESQISRVLNGSVGLSFDQLEEIARGLGMDVIDVITYPEVYVPRISTQESDIDAVLMVRLKDKKKQEILKSVFGDKNIEILNK